VKFLAAIFALGSITFFATPGMVADTLTGASATGDCSGYSVTVNATDLTPSTAYTITYTLTLNCADSTTQVLGSINFTTTSNGTTATETATGTWPGTPPALPIDCRVTNGSATLTSSGSTVPITINGQNEAELTCSGGTPPGAKSFGIGPSSMEGDLHVRLVPVTGFRAAITSNSWIGVTLLPFTRLWRRLRCPSVVQTALR